jgi:hypothetical protein
VREGVEKNNGHQINGGRRIKRKHMKKKIIVLLAVVLAASTPLAPQAEAIGFSISIGDRPYYYGPNYWHEGYQWVWVPGYRYHGNWVRGHYQRRGSWNRAYARHHYRHHHHNNWHHH